MNDLRRTQSRSATWPILLATGLTGALSLAGCAKQEPTPNTPPGPMGANATQDITAKLPGGESYAAAKKVYSVNNCVRCHKLGETGGGPGPGGPPDKMTKGGHPGGMGRGPDLTHVGSSPEHTKQWLSDHIRDAKSHKPKSRMPPYGADKIGDEDLMALADYLANQK